MKWLGLRARIMLALVLVVAAACGALTVATTHWVAENRDQQLMREMEWASSLDSDWLLTAVERNPGARRLTDLGGDRPSAGDEPGEAALIPLASPEVDVQLAEQYVGKLKVAKLNIDDNQETPAKFGIRGIPTLMLFKNGNVEATKVGALSKSQLTAFIDSNL